MLPIKKYIFLFLTNIWNKEYYDLSPWSSELLFVLCSQYQDQWGKTALTYFISPFFIGPIMQL